MVVNIVLNNDDDPAHQFWCSFPKFSESMGNIRNSQVGITWP